jgi:hypothetical protein
MVIENASLLWPVGALAGYTVFFAVVVAPKVFQVLPPDHAGTFLRAFFPNYYLWGLLVAAASTPIAVWTNWTVSLACAAVAILFVYARQVLMPKINAARVAQLRGESGAGGRFKQLHLQSVIVNGFQLLVLIVATAWLVWTP